uniref:Uncharacterized protein n=1 Tax=Anopheles christyi TaxID=43041 RepID=A0A182KCU9_9DIPT
MYVIVIVRYITEVVVVVTSDCFASVATTIMPEATSAHSGRDASFSSTSTDCVSYTIEGEMSSIDTSVATCSTCTLSCTSSPSTPTNSSFGVSCTIGSNGTTSGFTSGTFSTFDATILGSSILICETGCSNTSS